MRRWRPQHSPCCLPAPSPPPPSPPSHQTKSKRKKAGSSTRAALAAAAAEAAAALAVPAVYSDRDAGARAPCLAGRHAHEVGFRVLEPKPLNPQPYNPTPTRTRWDFWKDGPWGGVRSSQGRWLGGGKRGGWQHTIRSLAAGQRGRDGGGRGRRRLPPGEMGVQAKDRRAKAWAALGRLKGRQEVRRGGEARSSPAGSHPRRPLLHDAACCGTGRQTAERRTTNGPQAPPPPPPQNPCAGFRNVGLVCNV